MTKEELISHSGYYTKLPQEIFNLPLRPGEWRVLMVIAKWDNASSKLLSFSYLQKACYMSRKTVVSSIASLRLHKVIDSYTVGKGRGYKVNWYRIKELSSDL